MFTFDVSKRISTAVIKSNAIQVFILSVITLLTESILPVALLTLDFGLRAFNLGKYSPLTAISKRIIMPIFKPNGNPVTLAPKAFAARIGLALSIISFISYHAAVFEGFLIPVVLLAIFSFLEGFMGFCAGCKIYGLLIEWKIFKEEDCLDCKLE